MSYFNLKSFVKLSRRASSVYRLKMADTPEDLEQHEKYHAQSLLRAKRQLSKARSTQRAVYIRCIDVLEEIREHPEQYTITIYHGTSQKAYQQILQRGAFTSPQLRKQPDRESREFRLYTTNSTGTEEIFFSPNPSMCYNYAERNASADDSLPVIIKLQVPLSTIQEVAGMTYEAILSRGNFDKLYNEHGVPFMLYQVISTYTDKPALLAQKILQKIFDYSSIELTIKHAISTKYIVGDSSTESDVAHQIWQNVINVHELDVDATPEFLLSNKYVEIQTIRRFLHNAQFRHAFSYSQQDKFTSLKTDFNRREENNTLSEVDWIEVIREIYYDAISKHSLNSASEALKVFEELPLILQKDAEIRQNLYDLVIQDLKEKNSNGQRSDLVYRNLPTFIKRDQVFSDLFAGNLPIILKDSNYSPRALVETLTATPPRIYARKNIIDTYVSHLAENQQQLIQALRESMDRFVEIGIFDVIYSLYYGPQIANNYQIVKENLAEIKLLCTQNIQKSFNFANIYGMMPVVKYLGLYDTICNAIASQLPERNDSASSLAHTLGKLKFYFKDPRVYAATQALSLKFVNENPENYDFLPQSLQYNPAVKQATLQRYLSDWLNADRAWYFIMNSAQTIKDFPSFVRNNREFLTKVFELATHVINKSNLYSSQLTVALYTSGENTQYLRMFLNYVKQNHNQEYKNFLQKIIRAMKDRVSQEDAEKIKTFFAHDIDFKLELAKAMRNKQTQNPAE